MVYIVCYALLVLLKQQGPARVDVLRFLVLLKVAFESEDTNYAEDMPRRWPKQEEAYKSNYILDLSILLQEQDARKYNRR